MREDYQISITKDRVATMPLVTFPGDITVVDTPEAAHDAVAALKDEKFIGFDTETKPSFKKGHVNKVALMQLSTLTHCYLFRINILGITDDMASLLEDQAITKIGLSIHDDFHVMHRSSRVEPKGFVDLQNLVKNYHIKDISLQKIYAIIFGEKISKNQRLTNWEAHTLSAQQQRYAAIDAWTCLRVYYYLTSNQFHPEDSPYIVYPTDTE